MKMTRRGGARGLTGLVRTFVRLSYHLSVMGDDRDTCDLLCLDLEKAEVLRRSLPPADELETTVLPFKALTDPTRVAILLSLRDGETACVCDLAWIVGRDEKLVSHHVRLLKGLGVVRSRRDGRMVMYELTDLGAGLIDAFRARQPGAA